MDRGKGVPKEREVNRRREVFEDYRSVIDVKVDTQDCGLVLVRMFDNVTDLRFELGVKSSAAEAELVLVLFHIFNS